MSPVWFQLAAAGITYEEECMKSAFKRVVEVMCDKKSDLSLHTNGSILFTRWRQCTPPI